MAEDQSTTQGTLWGEEELPRKRCYKCDEVKSLADFNWMRVNGRPVRRKYQCKVCEVAYTRAWRKVLQQNDPEEYRQYQLRDRRRKRLSEKKVSEKDYREMMEKQNGVCAICGRLESTHKRGRVNPDRLSVDHCHKTGKVRGLLCGRCNRAIGLLRDNPALCRAAATYLERH